MGTQATLSLIEDMKDAPLIYPTQNSGYHPSWILESLGIWFTRKEDRYIHLFWAKIIRTRIGKGSLRIVLTLKMIPFLPFYG